jgi:DNA polymerase-3 subunit gamma/tau
MYGQTRVIDALKQSMTSGKIAHAYIFSGGRGTGKTTTARIFAHDLGVSENDIIEMDAASNRGIDDIRELREGVWTHPFNSPYKVYIIDEAHMLTREAWNALLKTLEEPPAHVLFILATTDRDKIPDTIQSRCEIYIFEQPDTTTLVTTITEVTQKEKYTIDTDAAHLIAQRADGSYRDALSLLQKVLSTTVGKNITLSDVGTAIRAPRGELVRELITHLATHEVAQALSVVAQAVTTQVDMRTYVRVCIDMLRLIILMRFSSTTVADVLAQMSAEDRVCIEQLSKNKNITSDTLRSLLSAHTQMAYATVPHLPLELAIIDICTSAK